MYCVFDGVREEVSSVAFKNKLLEKKKNKVVCFFFEPLSFDKFFLYEYIHTVSLTEIYTV